MTQAAQSERSHPYVVRTPGTCGGRARIADTRMAVWFVVQRIVVAGLTPEEFVDEYPDLGLAQVHAALSYFYDHRDEIERDLKDQEAAWPPRIAPSSS